MLIAACRAGGNQQESKREGWGYEREFPGGGNPVSFVLRLDKLNVSLADQIVMEQELRIESDFESEFPEYLPEDFEGFTVVAIARPPPSEPEPASAQAEASDKVLARRIETRQLTLEPQKSGDLAIAPLAVYFHSRGEAKESTFMTEEIPVKVEALADLGAQSARPPRDIFLAPPERASAARIVWAAAAASLLAALGLAFYYLRRRPLRLTPPVPDEVAYEALRRLVALDLIEKGEVELFFVHLSNILRQYIENRFQVRAPERTTEEFLDEGARNPALAHHRARLAEFLMLSDQVKFARYQPDAARIQGAFDVLKQFLAETTPREP